LTQLKQDFYENNGSFFYDLFHNNKDIMLLINPSSLDIIEANKAACHFYGYTHEELIKMKINQINILSSEQINNELRLAKEQNRNRFYFKHRLANGEIRHVEVTSNPVSIGSMVFLHSVVHDITADLFYTDLDPKTKMRMDALVAEKTYALEQENRFIESLFESIPGLLYVYDEQEKIVLWNKLHEKMTGYSADEMAKMTLHDWFDEGDYQRIQETIKQVFSQGFGEIEAHLLLKNGDKMLAKVNGVPLKMNGHTYLTGVGLDITKQKQDENDLKKSKELFEIFFEQSLSGFFYMMLDEPIIWDDSTDKEAVLDYVFEHQRMAKFNQALLNQYGVQAAEYINLTPNQLFKHDLSQGRDAWRKMFDNGHIHMVTEERHNDGRVIWIEGDYICIYDEQKRIIGHFGNQQDITDRIVSEKKLEHSYELMRYIIEHNNGGIAVHDKNLNYIFVSQQYLKQYGLENRNIIGMNHYNVFPDLPLKWRIVHDKALKGIVSSADDDPYFHDDGSVDWTRWECRPWHLSDGSIGGIIVYTEVINDRKNLELALIREKELLETTLISVGDGVISCDESGIILLMNSAAELLTGWKRSDAIGKIVDEVFNVSQPCENQSFKTMFDKVLFTDQLYEFSECAHLTSSQGTTIPIEGNISPIIGKNADRLGVVLVFRDVTLIKQRQAEIEYASYHDPLTGIYNYRYYEKQIKLLKTEENLPISIIMGDINGLKLINDSLGHAVGDELLIRAAQVIKSTCRPSDVVVRIGGDEFVILLPKTETHEVEKIVKDIKEAIKQETIESISLSISLGYETITSVDEDAQLTLTRAENHMYRHKISENLSPRSKTIDIIMNSLFEKNPREMAHSQRVSDLSVALATALGWSEDKINELRTSALMHDIGKIGIAESILNKPGKLNDEEWKTIMSHPEIGFRILNTCNEFSEIARYVLEHHEKWNGSGYPRGLKGEAISIQGRILAIADAFDAITSVRTYRATRTTNEAIEELRKYAGIQFDPGLVDFFIEHVLSLRQFSKL